MVEISDYPIFVSLMHEVYQKTFDRPLASLSFSERRDLSAIIVQQTGQPISGKILWTYVKRIVKEDESQKIPRNSTLDILAKYVLEGRSDFSQNNPFPYWYTYRKIWKEETSNSLSSSSIDQPKNSSNLARSLVFQVLLLITALVFVGIFLFQKEEVPFFSGQRFTTSLLDSLYQTNWFLLNPDLPKWVKSDTNQCLVMKTYQGDSWLDDPSIEPTINNILTHRINCGDCCEITIKIRSFHPNQRYQQGGFFLFYGESGEEIPSVRYTYDGTERATYVSAIYRSVVHQNESLLRDKSTIRRRITHQSLPQWDSHIDSIMLRLRVKESLYTFSRKVNDEEYISVKSMELPLSKPSYIGLAAFAGYAKIPPVIPVADSIEVYFEYLKINPCNSVVKK